MSSNNNAPKWSEFRKKSDFKFEPPELIDTGRNRYYGMDFAKGGDQSIIYEFEFQDGKVVNVNELSFIDKQTQKLYRCFDVSDAVIAD